MSSISKINRILEALRKNSRYGMANKDLSELVDLPPSTCHRIVCSLIKYNLVTRREKDLRLFLGNSHLRFGQAVLEKMNKKTHLEDHLDKLHIATGHTVFFAVPAINNVCSCVVMEVRGSVNTRIAIGQGEIMPIHQTAAGKAILAFVCKTQRKKIYQKINESKTMKTVRIREIEKELATIRDTMISHNFGSFHGGINAIATPVFDRRKKVAGSITLIGTASSLDESHMERLSSKLITTGRNVTESNHEDSETEGLAVQDR